MKKKYNVAVLGATGMVGKEMMRVLEQRNFPVDRFLPLASSRTAGTTVKFKGKDYTVEEAKPESFKGIDIGLFSAGAKVSKVFAPEAVKAGAVVIDNTSQFRMQPDVPLIVPEINAHALKKHKGIIANPNCSTAELVLVLKPIHDKAKIKRLVIATYQSTSGWGKEAVEELMQQTKEIMAGREKVEVKVLPKQIAFNVFPQIDVFLDNAYTKEEMKLVNETRKILEDDSIAITATCVRVPVMIGHAEAVNIETEKKITVKEVREILSKFPTIKVVDDPSKEEYPTPIDSAGIDDTLVGRIREDISCKNGIDLWIVSDNLRRGAALNAVLIAEKMIEMNLI